MATLNLKNLKMPKMTMENLLMAGAVVALVYALYTYGGDKVLKVEGASSGGNSNGAPQQNSVSGLPGADNFAPVNGMTGSEVQVPASGNKQVSNPADLLPKDSNSGWTNQQAGGGLDVSVVEAGHHIGTVGQVLRNANLQLRSEPANPQSAVGPWNQTTMSPDNNRRPLEIGA